MGADDQAGHVEHEGYLRDQGVGEKGSGSKLGGWVVMMRVPRGKGCWWGGWYWRRRK